MQCQSVCIEYLLQKPITSNDCTQLTKFCNNCNNFINYDGLNCPCCFTSLKSGIKILKKEERLKEIEFNKKSRIEARLRRDVLKKEREQKRLARKEEVLQRKIGNLNLPKEIIQKDRISFNDCQKHIDDIINTIKTKLSSLTMRVTDPKLNKFEICELIETELNQIQFYKKMQGYSLFTEPEKRGNTPTHKLTRSARSPYSEIGKLCNINPTMIEDIIRIKKYGDSDLINKVRKNEISITKAIRIIRSKLALSPRYNFKSKLLPRTEQSPFRFCPVCGTNTLEYWFSVKEVHCTKCDFYYTLSRRKH